MNLRVHGYPARLPDVLLVDDGVDSVLVAPDQEGTHLLNPTARAIWELCDGQTQPDEMVDAICLVFAITREAAASDVVGALDVLTGVGLIEWVPRGGDEP